MLAWIMVILFSATALFSLYQMNRLGLLPSAAAGDGAVFSAYSKPFEPTRLIIPMTGLFTTPAIQQTFVDDFTLGVQDWSALQGSISLKDESMQLSPNWLTEGGTAAWNLPDALLTPAFIYTADLATRAKAWQRFGLASNLQPDGSGLLFMVEPDTGKVAIFQRSERELTELSPWQNSPTLLPAPYPNRIEINCMPQSLILRINGVQAASISPPLPCNQGQLGLFILTPGSRIVVDNVSLSTLR